MLGESLSFPTNGDDTVKTLVIGAACLVFSFLILPAILLQGYLVRVLRAAAEGAETPPPFDDWGDMLIDGIMLIVVSLAYVIVPVILFFVASAVVGGGVLAGGNVGAGIGIVGGLLMLVAVLATLVAAFLIPAAATNFAREDSLGAAFDFGTVTSGALSGDYVVAYIMAIVVGAVLQFVGGLLAVILVGFLVLFYAQVVTYYLFGLGFARGLGEDGGTQATTEPGAV